MRVNRFAFAGLAMACLFSARVAAGESCKTFFGNFTAVPPAVCPSPVGICTHGTLTGGFPSTYDFVMDTLVPTLVPGVFAYTGHSLIGSATGTLSGADSGFLQMTGPTSASFVTVVRILSGTGAFTGATGGIVAPGKLDFVTGGTVGTYSGAVCTPGTDD